MKTAIAIVAIGHFKKGAEVLIKSLRIHNKNDFDIWTIGYEDVKGAFRIEPEVFNLAVADKWKESITKFTALRLPYDRIIIMDADMLCVDELPILFEDFYGFAAAQDFATQHYYKDIIDSIGLKLDVFINGGLLVFNGQNLDKLISMFDCCESYTTGDQGYLNYWRYHFDIDTKILPII